MSLKLEEEGDTGTELGPGSGCQVCIVKREMY